MVSLGGGLLLLFGILVARLTMVGYVGLTVLLFLPLLGLRRMFQPAIADQGLTLRRRAPGARLGR